MLYMAILSGGLTASVCALLSKGQSTWRSKADEDQSRSTGLEPAGGRESELRLLRAYWAWPTFNKLSATLRWYGFK